MDPVVRTKLSAFGIQGSFLARVRVKTYRLVTTTLDVVIKMVIKAGVIRVIKAVRNVNF